MIPISLQCMSQCAKKSETEDDGSNKTEDFDLHSATDKSLGNKEDYSNGKSNTNTDKREKKLKERDTNGEEQSGEKDGSVSVSQRRYMADGYPDLGPMPSLGIPHWCYTMDTVITDHLEGTKYSVRDYVEGRVDNNGHVIKKTSEIK